MRGEPDTFPEEVMEDVAYLSRSMSRVRLLDALTVTPQTRSELEEATGIARTTIDRIINELEERSWVQRTTDGAYTATPTGEGIVAEFKPFVESMQSIKNLGNLVAWLPTNEIPIDLHHFSDANVRRPDPTDPMSTIADFNNRLTDVSEFHCLVGVAPPIPFEQAMRDGVVNRGLSTEHVITDDELSYLLDQSDRLPRWREYIEAGANVYRYDGQIPCNLFVFDDTLVITNGQSNIGESLVGIVSENEDVLSWAHEVIKVYKEQAVQLDSSVFTGPADSEGSS